MAPERRGDPRSGGVMSELEAIKARAQNRRNLNGMTDVRPGTWQQAEADLDHALAIAEDWKNEYEAANDDSEQYRSEVGRLLQERDEARDNINLLREREQYLARELVQARAAVLQLRDRLRCSFAEQGRYSCKVWAEDHPEPHEFCQNCQALADTVSYEQYR